MSNLNRIDGHIARFQVATIDGHPLYITCESFDDTCDMYADLPYIGARSHVLGTAIDTLHRYFGSFDEWVAAELNRGCCKDAIDTVLAAYTTEQFGGADAGYVWRAVTNN